MADVYARHFSISLAFGGGAYAYLLSVATLPSPRPAPQMKATSNYGLVDRLIPGDRTRVVRIRVRRLDHYNKATAFHLIPQFVGVLVLAGLNLEAVFSEGPSRF